MRPIAIPALAAALALSGCLTLKPGTDTADLGVGGDDGPMMGGPDMMPDLAMNCWNPSGFGGRGCFNCTPTTREQLLNSCNTTSQCISFDTPLPLGDGGLPHWPDRDMLLPPDMATITDMASTDMASNADLAGPPQYPACASLPGVVYVTGSSAVAPFL